MRSYVCCVAVCLLSLSLGGVLGTQNSTSEFEVPSSILFEVTSLALQLGKLNQWYTQVVGYPNLVVPNIFTWNFDREQCDDSGRCDVIHEQITIGGQNEEGVFTTALFGASENAAQVTFGARNFTYVLTIPELALYSTDFIRIQTNKTSSTSINYSSLTLNISNTVVGIAGDFDFDQRVNAYQVKNVNVTMELGELSISIPNVLSYDGDQWTTLPPVEKNAAPEIMSQWRAQNEEDKTLEERYEQFLEAKINGILANN